MEALESISALGSMTAVGCMLILILSLPPRRGSTLDVKLKPRVQRPGLNRWAPTNSRPHYFLAVTPNTTHGHAAKFLQRAISLGVKPADFEDQGPTLRATVIRLFPASGPGGHHFGLGRLLPVHRSFGGSLPDTPATPYEFHLDILPIA